MKRRSLTEKEVERFHSYMIKNEYAPGTIEKYRRDVRRFHLWLDGREVTKQVVLNWKEQLISQHYAPVTINSMLAALNRFFKVIGWPDLRVKELRIQRRLFRRPERELSQQEYTKLVQTALDHGKQRLALLMQTICATGIRVSEVKYITVETVRSGRAEIRLKGKIRTILIPNKLRRKLEKYAKKQKIVSGEIFLTRNGRGLSRRQIWAEMKSICKKAGILPTKVFPHNLRHVFARAFYKASRDVVQLADILGHSSIETTRIYLVSSGAEHIRRLNQLPLIL